MVSSKSRNRRRNYFIDREFQTRFILKFCIPVIFTAFISAFVVYYFLSQSVTTVFENSRIIIKSGTEFIMPGLVLSTLVSVVLVGIGTMVVMLFMSHRIAGPLYKLESSLDRLATGDMSFNIYFRKWDELKRMADVFNKASLRLNTMIGDIKEESKKLDLVMNELKVSPRKSSVNERAIKKLEIINDKLVENLLKFRLR